MTLVTDRDNRRVHAVDVHASTTMVLVRVHTVDHTGLGYTYGDVSVASFLSAVDLALWDLKARRLGLPLVQLLPAHHDRVPVYGSGGFTNYSLDRLADQLGGWVRQGIQRVKLKTSREPERDPQRPTAVRKAVGDEPELFVDANGALARKEALYWAHRFHDEWDVRWFEEPVSSADLEGRQPRHPHAWALLDREAGGGYRPSAPVAPLRPDDRPGMVRPARGHGQPAGRPVVLFPDTFNNHFHTNVGVACVEAIEAAGWRVVMPEQHRCCGRPLYDYGFLDTAERCVHQVLDTLRRHLRADAPMVGMEPSCLAVFKDELPKLLPHDDDAKRLTRNAYHFPEFFQAFGIELPELSGQALLWGHCHQRATGGKRCGHRAACPACRRSDETGPREGPPSRIPAA
jgi:hypothetical protein